MSDVHGYLWLIPALPLFAAVVIAFLGPRFLRGQSHWPCVAAILASCLLAFWVLSAVDGLYPMGEGGGAVKPDQEIVETHRWLHVGPMDLSFTLRADGLTAIMLATVTFVGFFIAVYSIGYMHGDPG